MQMDLDERSPQQPYHPPIPSLLRSQDHYAAPQYTSAGGYQAAGPQSAYQPIQPQPAREYSHPHQGYGYGAPQGAGGGQYDRNYNSNYTAVPSGPGPFGPPEPTAAGPRGLALPPLHASSPHHQSWQGQSPPYAYNYDNYGPLPNPRDGSNYESMVGKSGYPNVAPSRGPKQRFTGEDDDLLRKLKENYVNPRLSWKQIADFFPDRNSGTLQVRYCTKLKRKDEVKWTEEMDQKLLDKYKEDRDGTWRRIAQKMGTGASEEACRDRYETLTELEEAERLKRSGISDGDDIESVRG